MERKWTFFDFELLLQIMSSVDDGDKKAQKNQIEDSARQSLD
jgi:hypothetical protein